MSPLDSPSSGQTSQLTKKGVLTTELGFTTRELTVLAVAGVMATLAIAFLQTPLRVPGHAILKAALPLACGMAFVVKPLAGTLAASASLFAAAALLLVGLGNLQVAALVSLLLIGPAFDWARHNAPRNQYPEIARFALIGLAVNLTAFAVRWGTAFWQADGWHPLNFRTLGLTAIVSFAVCGLAAGLMCGALCRSQKTK